MAIIGAGPCGYTLALFLSKKGYQIDLFEKRNDPLLSPQSEIGRSTNFLFSDRALEVFERLNLAQKVKDMSKVINYFSTKLTDGTSIDIQYSKEVYLYSLKREYLQNILAQEISHVKNIRVNYNSCIT